MCVEGILNAIANIGNSIANVCNSRGCDQCMGWFLRLLQRPEDPTPQYVQIQPGPAAAAAAAAPSEDPLPQDVQIQPRPAALPGDMEQGTVFLNARELEIKHVHNPECWRWINNDPRFGEVAELENVCRLEIEREVNIGRLSRNVVSYNAYLVYRLTDDSKGFNGGKHKDQRAIITLPPNLPRVEPSYLKLYPNAKGQYCRRYAADQAWMEALLGVIPVASLPNDGVVKIKFMETSDAITKSGLIVAGIELRPAAPGP